MEPSSSSSLLSLLSLPSLAAASSAAATSSAQRQANQWEGRRETGSGLDEATKRSRTNAGGRDLEIPKYGQTAAGPKCRCGGYSRSTWHGSPLPRAACESLSTVGSAPASSNKLPFWHPRHLG